MINILYLDALAKESMQSNYTIIQVSLTSTQTYDILETQIQTIKV